MENSRMSFQDFRDRISIIEVAKSLGYSLNRSAGLRKPEYVLFENGKKVDEIVIYNPDDSSRQTFFSRGYGDQGNLTYFVKNRLDRFSVCSSGFEGVNEALNAFLGNPDMKMYKENETFAARTYDFNLKDYEVVAAAHPCMAYLANQRCISRQTIKDFIKVGAIHGVRNRKHEIFNVGFPYRVPGTSDIVNYELRNGGSKPGAPSFKSFCAGGVKSNACWIASFGQPKDIRNIYIGESAIDMMSLYEILGGKPRSAYVSTGGNPVKGQIDKLQKLFPNAALNLCHDDDGTGMVDNIVVALYFRSKEAKGFYNKAEDTLNVTVGESSYNIRRSPLADKEFLRTQGYTDKIIVPRFGKDFNEELKDMKFNNLMETSEKK